MQTNKVSKQTNSSVEIITAGKLKQYNKKVQRKRNQANNEHYDIKNRLNMELSSVLGHQWNKSSQQRGSSQANTCYAYGDQIIYYMNNMFIALDIHTRKTSHFVEDLQIEGSQVQFIKFFPQKKNTLLVILKKSAQGHYISMLWVDKALSLECQDKKNQHGYTVKVPQSDPNLLRYIDMGYHSEKNYLYLLSQSIESSAKNRASSSKQSIQIIEISCQSTKCKLILPQQKIKNAKQSKQFQQSKLDKQDDTSHMFGNGADTYKKEEKLNILVSCDPRQFYIWGKQYFRCWKINFHEKNIAYQSCKNIERAIRFQKVLSVYLIPSSEMKYLQIKANKKINEIQDSMIPHLLIIITQDQSILAHKNQILKRVEIPLQSHFTKASLQKQANQLAIEKSLNEVYKTKFRMETIQQYNEEDNLQKQQNNKKQANKFGKNKQLVSISSNFWITQDQNEDEGKASSNRYIFQFCSIVCDKKMFIYSIMPDFQLKISAIITIGEKLSNSQFLPNISVSKQGNLILVSDIHANLYITQTNWQSLELMPLFGQGCSHRSEILSISSPQLNQSVITVDNEGYVKIWNVSEKQKGRGLIIDYKPKNKPLHAIIHPSGLLLALNFGNEIKIYGIVSSLLQELAAIKTNDFCSYLYYCKVNHCLISNQKSFLKFYEPFTLKCNHRIEPEDLRLEIKHSQISDNGQFVVYQCCNNKIYRYSLANFVCRPNQEKYSNSIVYGLKGNQQKQCKSYYCHKQDNLYTCFYFDFGKCKDMKFYNKQKKAFFMSNDDQPSNFAESKNQNSANSSNIFVGFTQTKYMVIYGDYAERLIAEIPISNCFITDLLVENRLMFLSTSNGEIRTCQWPIVQQHLQFKTYTTQNSILAKVQQPEYNQYKVWYDQQKISKISKICCLQRLVVANQNGSLAFINYRKGILQYNHPTNGYGNSQQQHQRQKLKQQMASIKYIKLAEQQRINKLIQKTQNDIIKLQQEINKQKQQKINELNNFTDERTKNYLKRAQGEQQQYKQYYHERVKELRKLQNQYKLRQIQIIRQRNVLQQDSVSKIQYQKERLQLINNEQIITRDEYKEKIRQIGIKHRQKIKQLKMSYLYKIKTLQKQFQSFVSNGLSFSNHDTTIEQIPININQSIGNSSSLQQSLIYVQELGQQMQRHQQKLAKLDKQNKQLSKMDIQMQKQFETCLQEYNRGRYDNLLLHSEVLKMQNQLLDRKKILQKKDQVISVIRYEKQVNQTFKAFASGEIGHIQLAKKAVYDEYLKKDEELKALFNQLERQIRKGEDQKLKLTNLNRMIQLHQKQIKSKKDLKQDYKKKLKDIKRLLLLEGLNDAERKKIIDEQQKLLVSIRWLEKRFKMTCINEKKMIVLKKEGVQQIIKQNKNLLEECNQLRQESIEYQNQINHLSQKLAEANRIIELQRKVKNQKNDLTKQSMKLEQIRSIFSKQLNILNEQQL